MIVMKFGGSSVGTADAIRQVADIVLRYRDVRPVLVVSALRGVTDELLGLARVAASGGSVDEGLAALRERHEAVASVFGGGGEVVRALMSELDGALRGIAAKRALDDRSSDEIVSFGERLSAPLVAAAIAQRCIEAIAADSRTLVETDDRFGAANVDFPRTYAKLREGLLPAIERGAVPVVTGFIGATAAGETTTLGRGGSDYSVAIVAAGLGAKEIWIWKEVDGVMTADPTIIPDAAIVSEISYDEAAEMSYFGAKVLHPKTMIPAVEAGIPIRMRNTFRPDAPGTAIGATSSPAPHGVKVVTAAKGLAMVTVEGRGMVGIAEPAAHVFQVAGRHRVNIVMFSQSSSEQNICLLVGRESAATFAEALERDLREQFDRRLFDRIDVEDKVAAVAVVGEGMRGSPGVAGRLFTAVAAAGVNVLAIAQGSSERNISFVVRESEADAAVRAAHAAFALHALPTTV
jgi:aspartokinase/homoserine dehydrogenase 1